VSWCAGHTRWPKRERERKETFYTPASEELIEARKSIAKFSWDMAQRRLARQRAVRDDPDELMKREDDVLTLQGEPISCHSAIALSLLATFGAGHRQPS